jgi:hypothetical protein
MFGMKSKKNLVLTIESKIIYWATIITYFFI